MNCPIIIIKKIYINRLSFAWHRQVVSGWSGLPELLWGGWRPPAWKGRGLWAHLWVPPSQPHLLDAWALCGRMYLSSWVSDACHMDLFVTRCYCYFLHRIYYRWSDAVVWAFNHSCCEVTFLASQTVSDIEDTFMLTNSYVDFLILFVEFNHFLYLMQGKDHLQLIWQARENV